MSEDIKDTSLEFDGCIGKVNKEDAPVTLSGFLGEEEKYTPETEEEAWKQTWVGMPSYKSDDIPLGRKLIVTFESDEAFDEFCKKLEIKLTNRTKSTYYPPKKNTDWSLTRWIDDDNV